MMYLNEMVSGRKRTIDHHFVSSSEQLIALENSRTIFKDDDHNRSRQNIYAQDNLTVCHALLDIIATLI